MALTRSYRGTYHEVWAEAVPQNGGDTQVMTTSIPFGPTESVNLIDTILTPALVVGAPVLTVTPSSAGGVLVLTIANTAAPGNTITFGIDTRYIHSIQQ